MNEVKPSAREGSSDDHNPTRKLPPDIAQRMESPSRYIGWDVGAWYCKKNGKSKDAIAIHAEPNSDPITWTGNLTETIKDSTSCLDFLKALADLCTKQEYELTMNDTTEIVLAVDAILGLPSAATKLFTDGSIEKYPIAENPRENKYLYRWTERFLSEKGFAPLSVLEQMLGSQSTKAAHALRQFGLTPTSEGVWRSAKTPNFVVIETYPAACSEDIKSKDNSKDRDTNDAITCANVAMLYATDKSRLQEPPKHITSEIIKTEGWIWVPK